MKDRKQAEQVNKQIDRQTNRQTNKHRGIYNVSKSLGPNVRIGNKGTGVEIERRGKVLI